MIVWKLSFCFLCFLWTAELNKTSHIWARIFFIFLENVLKQTCNSFNTKFQPQSKHWKSSYKVKQVFGMFLPLNCSNFRLKKYQGNKISETNSTYYKLKSQNIRD